MLYVSEDAMDCNYGSSAMNSRCGASNWRNFQNVLPNTTSHEDEAPSSPELFSDGEQDDGVATTLSTNDTSTFQKTQTQPSPIKLTQEELIHRADCYVARRINKFLSGVPPPPNYTVCPKDCNDFLVNIRQNRQYFWADPFVTEDKFPPSDVHNVSLVRSITECLLVG